MRIAQGYIYKPENPKVIQDSVRLEISDNKIEFEYTENSPDLSVFSKIGVILGVFNGIGKVTFLDCNMSGSASGSGANVKKYNADLMLLGVHISDWQKFKFSKCIVNIPSLFDWVGISAIKNRLWTENKLYSEIPEEIKLATFEKYELLFSFGYQSKFAKNKIHLNQYTNLKIVALKDEIHLSDLLDIIVHFKKFILLIANESPFSETITLFSNKYKYEHDRQLIPIDLVVNPERQNNIQLSISAIRIEFNKIQNNFEEIIKTWYENTKLYSSIDLIIEKFLNPKLSRENDFLNSCFSIETFHRRFRKLEVFEKPIFKKIRKSIIDNIENDDHKKFIKEKLAYANEPTFRARLLDLKTRFENILPSDMNVDDYIIKIVKTRNFLVHRTQNENTFDDFDMFYAARYIESIVRICILIELKFPEKIIHKVENCNKSHLQQMYHLNKRMKTSVPNKSYI
jgi:hypothetical protein